MPYILNQYGQRLPLEDISFVENVLKLKQKSGTNPWPVIEEIIKFWSNKNRTRWNAFLLEIEDVRSTRKDRKFGSTYDKQNGGYLRYTLDIPQEIMYMIRCIYTATELPMDKKSGFFREFARKFPIFRVAEKI